MSVLRAGWAPLALLAWALAFTWPAATGVVIAGHQPDALGTAWFIDAAPRLSASLSDPLTGFPDGAVYGRPDSFVLLALGAVLGEVDAVRLHGLVAVVGVWLSAWAAEAFARALGATRPWSLLAGLAFTGCGLAATALLEGYVYHLLDPWLPLLGWSWLRATSRGGTVAHGVAAGVCFTLALLTTAWIGMAAVVLVVGFGAGGLLRERRAFPLRPALAAAITVAIPLALYLRAFLAAGDATDTSMASPHDVVRHLQFALVRLAAPGLSVDIDGHAQSAATPATVLVLLGAAPLVLRGERGWRTIACTGLFALAASLSPRVDPATWTAWAPGPVRDGLALVAGSLLRFPERLGWTWALCAGVVAARVATALAAAGPRAAAGLLVAALLDPLVVARVPWRQRAAIAETPSAYLDATGPVLDLWPEDVAGLPSWDLRTTNTGCFYQLGHGRPIADHCVFVHGRTSPRLQHGRVVTDLLLRGDAEPARAALAGLGFTTLALHPDLYGAGDRARLAASLAVLDATPTSSTDGGDHVVAYAIAP